MYGSKSISILNTEHCIETASLSCLSISETMINRPVAMYVHFRIDFFQQYNRDNPITYLATATVKFQNMLYNTRKSFLRRVFKHFHERILHFKTLSSIYHDDVGISTINRCIPLCVQFALLPISFYTIRSDFEIVQTCYLSIDAIYYFPNNRSSVRIKTFPRNVPNEPKP